MARPRKYDEQVAVRLVEEASRLLAARGPDALTVRGVADAANVTTSAIYQLYGGKEGLVRAVFVEGFARFDAALAAAGDGADPVQHLKELGRAYRCFATGNPHFHAVMFGMAVPEFTVTDEDAIVAARSFQRLVDAVIRAQASGDIRAADPVELAMGVWGLVHGLATLEVRGLPEGVDADVVFETATTALIRGLVAP